MLKSFSLIVLSGLLLGALCRRLRVPGILGMLLAGVALGPCGLNWLDSSVLGISSELRQMALMIILIRAGLSLDFTDLKKVGRAAMLMSFVPASFEILGCVLLAPGMLGLSRVEAAVLGAVLGAVSPAVVVPRRLKLMDEGYGTRKGLPQMIMAGASCDDIFTIALFSTFAGMAQGNEAGAASLVDIPVSILLGVALGAVCGFVLSWLFRAAHARGHAVRGSVKVMVLLAVAFLLAAVENEWKGRVAISGLLAVVAMACVVKRKSAEPVTARLSEKFGKLWLAAEVLLFVLVGAAVDVRYMLEAGAAAVGLIFAALLFRALGVLLCLVKTPFNRRERLFCVLAYLPKATVQAAMGSVPLSMGLPCGALVLSVAVLSIFVTAPLGAFAIDRSYSKLLKKE